VSKREDRCVEALQLAEALLADLISQAQYTGIARLDDEMMFARIKGVREWCRSTLQGGRNATDHETAP